MAESVVSSVEQTIGKLLIDEVKFLWGVGGKVKDLQKELKLIKCLLGDAGVRPEDGQTVGEWITQLRDIAYDAEDVIERYILRVAPKKEENIIKAYARFVAKRTWVQAHMVGKDIAGLKSSIFNLRTSMQDYSTRMGNEGERKRIRASKPKRTYAHSEEDFVGREDRIKELVKELLKDGEQHRVISICGMGGLGKTTLVKEVLAHDEVKNHFEGFAWACISQEYDARDIWEGILATLIPDQRERVTHMQDDELSQNLHKAQKQRRFIVVLDDIWTKPAWDDLRAAFPVKSTRSKLVITTRNREVAEHIDPRGFFHEPRFLSYEESWELLMKKAFPKTEGLAIGLSSVGPGVGQRIPVGQAVEGITRQLEMERQRQVIDENMKRVGDELLKKCGGLPSAVNVLGGLLAVNEWEMVYKKINLHFSDKSDVSKDLALSYADLPWHLKPCFLYLGSFPEDAEIPAKKVLRMWIAEGLVSLTTYDEHKEVPLEDVAEQYLVELGNRKMVQVARNLSGKIKTCRLHNLMRDLCIFKAGEERFLSFLKVQQDDESEDRSSSMGMGGESTYKTRRLSLNMRVTAEGNTISGVKKMERTMGHLRTLMVFLSKVPFIGTWEQFQPIFINCKFLRILKLEDLDMRGKLPESVGDLVHLRYLSLEGSNFESLPESLGNLVCMESLNLRMKLDFEVTIPNVLWKMKKLRHLHLPYRFDVNTRKKLRLDTLKNLRTLRNFCPKNCDVSDVGKLINLRKLNVRLEYGSNKLEIMPRLAKSNWEHLESSSFRFWGASFTEGGLSQMSSYRHSCKLSLYGDIEKLPEHKNLPQQLRKLVLLESELEEDPMPILEKLQLLVVLMLGYNAFVGKEMVCSAGGFPQLKHLLLHELYNLEELRVAEGALPHLSQSWISHCPNLKTSPPGVLTYDCSEFVNHEFDKCGGVVYKN